mgnify:CR=1 FL=1
MSLITENELSPELLELEKQLESLVPSSMSQDLFGRMEQSMHEATDERRLDSDDLDDLEIHLGQMAPASMPEDILGRMARAMDRWHEHVPVEEKVVPFGENEGESEEATPSHKRPSRKRYGGGMLAAAAAVAILGAVTALVMPKFMNASDVGESVATIKNTVVPDRQISAFAEPRDAWIVPDSLSHKVTNTSDRGVVMSRDNTPHRCIRVEYVDRIKVQDEEGREIEIERPGVNIMLMPVETN